MLSSPPSSRISELSADGDRGLGVISRKRCSVLGQHQGSAGLTLIIPCWRGASTGAPTGEGIDEDRARIPCAADRREAAPADRPSRAGCRTIATLFNYIGISSPSPSGLRYCIGVGGMTSFGQPSSSVSAPTPTGVLIAFRHLAMVDAAGGARGDDGGGGRGRRGDGAAVWPSPAAGDHRSVSRSSTCVRQHQLFGAHDASAPYPWRYASAFTNRSTRKEYFVGLTAVVLAVIAPEP